MDSLRCLLLRKLLNMSSVCCRYTHTQTQANIRAAHTYTLTQTHLHTHTSFAETWGLFLLPRRMAQGPMRRADMKLHASDWPARQWGGAALTTWPWSWFLLASKATQTLTNWRVRVSHLSLWSVSVEVLQVVSVSSQLHYVILCSCVWGTECVLNKSHVCTTSSTTLSLSLLTTPLWSKGAKNLCWYCLMTLPFQHKDIYCRVSW